MTRLLHIALVTLAALACACFATSCNLMEALHQTDPGYRNPIPFCTPWWDRREEAAKAREFQHFQREWAVKLAPLLLLLLLPSCMVYKGADGTLLGMVGTNAASVRAGGLEALGVNQSEGIREGGKIILQSALISAGANVLKTGISEGADLIDSALD